MKPSPVASLTKEDWEIALRNFRGSSDRWWHNRFYATQRADRRDAELMLQAARHRAGQTPVGDVLGNVVYWDLPRQTLMVQIGEHFFGGRL
jgi:hypothetical protein